MKGRGYDGFFFLSYMCFGSYYFYQSLSGMGMAHLGLFMVFFCFFFRRRCSMQRYPTTPLRLRLRLKADDDESPKTVEASELLHFILQ